jgi:hypothetical protein
MVMTTQNNYSNVPKPSIPAQLHLLTIFILNWQFVYWASDTAVFFLIGSIYRFSDLLTVADATEIKMLANTCPEALLRGIAYIKCICIR